MKPSLAENNKMAMKKESVLQAAGTNGKHEDVMSAVDEKKKEIAESTEGSISTPVTIQMPGTPATPQCNSVQGK